MAAFFPSSFGCSNNRLAQPPFFLCTARYLDILLRNVTHKNDFIMTSPDLYSPDPDFHPNKGKIILLVLIAVFIIALIFSAL